MKRRHLWVRTTSDGKMAVTRCGRKLAESATVMTPGLVTCYQCKMLHDVYPHETTPLPTGDTQ